MAFFITVGWQEALLSERQESCIIHRAHEPFATGRSLGGAEEPPVFDELTEKKFGSERLFLSAQYIAD